MLLDSTATFRKGALAAALLCTSGALYAGTFFLTLGNSAASRDPLAKDAVFLVRPDGCHDPSKAAVRATAEGLVDGRRVSVPLKPVILSAPGTYAIRREWGPQGTWVIVVTAADEGRTASALVPVSSEGFRRERAKVATGAPNFHEIDAMLAAAAR